MSRRTGRGAPRRRRPKGRSLVGETHLVDVGPVAHGGHFVARLPDAADDAAGTVVFVRHSLPGEQVTVQITEGAVGDRFLRGDAVAVHRASPDRVQPPCPFAGPGLCGGCDLQHVALPAQRALKAAVVAEQLRRLAGLDVAVEVEPVPGDGDGLGWRTRMRYHRTEDGRLGLRAHRSDRVVPVTDCRIEAPGARVSVEGEVGSDAVVTEQVRDRAFEVSPDGFWQVHRGATDVLVDAVLAGAEVRPGDRVLDLYAGVGLFSVFLAERTGQTGRVVAVEGDRTAAGHAEANLAAYPWTQVRAGAVDRHLGDLAAEGEWDVVVLDPPREGARRAVVEAVVAAGPRTVVYVACDPAAFARDAAWFAEAGYALESLRAFDLFPMTHHVECVGVLHRLT